jgi:hypothetical protein
VTIDENVAKKIPERYGENGKISTVLREETCIIVAQPNSEWSGSVR